MLRKHLDESVSNGEVPGGVLLLFRGGEPVFEDSFGYRHVRRKQPFLMNTPIRAASISKSIVATLIVKLAADGIFDLDLPIDTYLPDALDLQLESEAQIDRLPTLRQCLNHTAGFRSDYDPGGRPWLSCRHQSMTLSEVVKQELEMPLSSPPGYKFAYSGIGYDIAGRIVEVCSGRPFEEVLGEQLLSPLEMTETTYSPDRETVERMASFYWRWRCDGRFRRKLNEPPIEPGYYTSIGGGLVSTSGDLAKFVLLHRNRGKHKGKQIVPAAAIEEMYNLEKPARYYGLGLMLAGKAEDGLAREISHTGSSGTLFWWDRKRDIAGVLITQHRYSDGKSLPESKKDIGVDAPTWQETTKKNIIVPMMD